LIAADGGWFGIVNAETEGMDMSETSVSVGRVYHETHGHVLKIVIDNAVKKILSVRK
jgi:hypothetical protein